MLSRYERLVVIPRRQNEEVCLSEANTIAAHTTVKLIRSCLSHLGVCSKVLRRLEREREEERQRQETERMLQGSGGSGASPAKDKVSHCHCLKCLLRTMDETRITYAIMLLRWDRNATRGTPRLVVPLRRRGSQVSQNSVFRVL